MDFGLAAGYTCFHVQLHAPKDIRFTNGNVLLIPWNILLGPSMPQFFHKVDLLREKESTPEHPFQTSEVTNLLLAE
ncbi:hypothetical protein K0M31_013332 [Melipona bicolor]|uniref:Uncharacterized protein n=1 Tax=Melipona bicolor TaxID=60889 RepID=A0AA40FIC6_9HYME|nr:hypothetical protein K0M31_013332 [Melipona bicolor]